MITKIEIAGFKRFKSQTFELKPLTILAGLNGSGKSSLIHSILLAEEAARSSAQGIIQLNGPFGLELGTVGDILNWEAGDQIKFDIHEDNGIRRVYLDCPSEECMYVMPDLETVRHQESGNTQKGKFTYLSAERYGPKLSHTSCSLPADMVEVGTKGENCAQLLEALGNKPLDEHLLHPLSTTPSFLKYEVERWLAEIARPVEIEAERFSDSNVYGLKFRTPGGSWVKSTNMGFGVSYSLPIILAALTAAEGGIIIVENPEAHLHPLGQSRMGNFLTWIASKGIQVIIETHSDHIINGVRRAIGESEILQPEDGVIHFFDDETFPAVQQLNFMKNGSVSNWPNGFFDQYQIDTAALGRLRRKRG
ncbi:DUF3696 domain-containing protein [Ectopseudomonas oleovorans]|uniref:Putative ATPase n=1 Tax=Ectopseudomonas oleovorans TaxID=301 RepID=A0A3D9EGB6_ECTOL|nr:DUF3696 domain-containing protein [Pseudomonas oleovorans]RED02036.1 putative ATPase [Pseudomonas oleovorans]